MKILTAFKRLFRSWGPTDDRWYNAVSPQSKAGTNVNPETALTLSAVWAAVNFLAGTIASLPLHLYRHTGDGKEKATTNPLYNVLHSQANPLMISYNARETVMVNLLMSGNSYSEIVHDRAGKVTAYWPIQSNRVTPEFKGGSVVYEIQLPGGGKVVLPKSRVLHIPGLGFNGLVGKSVIEVARESLGLNLAMEEYGARFFSNDATPGGVLEHPGKLDDAAFDRLGASWARANQGLKQAHKIAILEEGMKFHETSISPEDSQFLQSRQHSISEVARWFNLPPHVLKDLTKSSFSNIERQSIELVVYTLRPWLVRLEQSYNSSLITKDNRSKLFTEHSIQGLLRGDAAARSEYYGKMFNIGAMSINNIRQLENLNDIEGGGKHFVPLNMIPLEQAGQVPVEPIPDTGTPETKSDESVKKKAVFKLPEARSEKAILSDMKALQNEFLKPIEKAARKLIEYEVSHVRAAINQHLTRSVDSFEKWLEDFYIGMTTEVDTHLGPVYKKYLERVRKQGCDILKLNIDSFPALKKWKREYIKGYVERHIGSSSGQILEILKNTPIEDFGVVLGKRLDEWMEKRPGKISRDQVVRASNATLREAYKAAGVKKMQWVTQGSKSCDFCNSLNGKVVSIVANEDFIEHGEVLKGKTGAGRRLKIYGPKAHPPIHQACVCAIIPMF